MKSIAANSEKHREADAGTRAAAVFGWIFEHCQRAALEAGATKGGAGWVSVSQVELGRRLL